METKVLSESKIQNTSLKIKIEVVFKLINEFENSKDSVPEPIDSPLKKKKKKEKAWKAADTIGKFFSQVASNCIANGFLDLFK